MTIGKNSRKSSVRSSIRAPKFLDKSSGFYGRLDEPESATEERGREVEENGGVKSSSSQPGADEREEAEAFEFTEGTMGDDGETLLRRKPGRSSSRWRRSSRRKQKDGEQARDERPGLDTERPADAPEDSRVKTEEEKTEEESEKTGRAKEAALVHFPVREEEDNQVLIRDKKRGREEEEEEGEEERRMKREQEEGMKMVKRNTAKNYRKALDRAFRRGWEAFITNLYSVTLTPVTSSSSPPPSSPSLKKKQLHRSVLAEFR
ncbi:octapeptide-repeat protein T2 [Embiotoca jacksoni]|uniref:octapeptide-repeat protein T2 n=1 Tax=Embiotoca jacksoni TaxID=100190 RepID=UPI003703A432